MDVATPTSDCLHLVHDLLTPVIMKGNGKSALSHQEVHMQLSIINFSLRFLFFFFVDFGVM